MTDVTQLVVNEYRLRLAREFVDSFANTTVQYYIFAGSYPGSEGDIPFPYDSIRTTLIDAWRRMIFGKKVGANSASLSIRRVNYTSNTVFDTYDDDDDTLLDKDYYAVVNASSYYHVWKCLENGNGGVSTVIPDISDASAGDDVFYPVDGYRWKYMYTVPVSTVTKFATSEYFPVLSNTAVVNAAVNGSIDVIKVESAGRGYDNYTNGTFSSADLRLDGNTHVYALESYASANNDFYEGCYLYITSGGSGAGQYRKIISYVANNDTKYVVISEPFDTPPASGWTYEVSPAVLVVGDGYEESNADARAIVNPSGNSIQRVEVLSRGSGYRYATASVVAAPIVQVDVAAQVRPIYSPRGGHGSDPASELGCKYVAMHVNFAAGEANTIPVDFEYNQIGVLKDPLWTKVSLVFSTQYGTFSGDEKVYKVNPVQLGGVANVSTGNTVVSVTGATPSDQLTVGDMVLIESTANNFQLVSVASANSTSFTVNTAALFTDPASTYYAANASVSGYVEGTAILSMDIRSLDGELAANDRVVGVTSGAYGIVDTVTINDQSTKNFNTYVQAYVYEGELLHSDFVEGETIYQTALNAANAVFVTTEGSGTTKKFYAQEQVGAFNVGTNFLGVTSGAVATVLNKHEPDLVHGSGEVLFLENNYPIERTSDQSETFKVVLEF